MPEGERKDACALQKNKNAGQQRGVVISRVAVAPAKRESRCVMRFLPNVGGEMTRAQTCSSQGLIRFRRSRQHPNVSGLARCQGRKKPRKLLTSAGIVATGLPKIAEAILVETQLAWVDLESILFLSA